MLLAVLLLACGAAALSRMQVLLAWAGDEVRHQSEALWLAQQALEQSRAELGIRSRTWMGADALFTVQGQLGEMQPNWDASAALALGGAISSNGASATPAIDPLPLTAARVSVSWTDRSGQLHTLELQTLLPTTDPVLHAWLTRADG